jgi:hypothetical protein
MNYDNSSMKHAITSLISVISSTLRGVEYLISKKNMVNLIFILIIDYNRKCDKNLKIIRTRKCNLKILFSNFIKI